MLELPETLKPMKLVFLTRFHSQNGMGGQHALKQRLVDAALAHGHELQIINPAEVVLDFNSSHGAIPVRWRGQPYPTVDLTLPMARWDDQHIWQVVDTLQSWGQPIAAHQRLPLGDHVTMARLLARRNIPAPRSWVLGSAEQIRVIMNELVFPVLMRSRYGGTGRKVAVVQHSGEAYSFAAQLAAGGQSFLVQDLPFPLGEDIRALVIGNRVEVALHRTAPLGFVRPKEDGNPKATLTKLSDAETELALAAAKLYGAPFCAVNLLRTAQGPQLLELSRVPTLNELERTSGRDLATPIVHELVAIAERMSAKSQAGPVVPLRRADASANG